MSEAPWLDCPVCWAPAFEAVPCKDCGDEECACDGTGWVWYETPWRFCDGCGCGVRVDVSDGVAQVDYDEDMVPSE